MNPIKASFIVIASIIMCGTIARVGILMMDLVFNIVDIYHMAGWTFFSAIITICVAGYFFMKPTAEIIDEGGIQL